jgi:Domain of unknown function (DUF4145)
MVDANDLEESSKRRIYCNFCKQHTNHESKGEHAVKWYDEDHFFGQILIYHLWICSGCERGVLQQEYSNSEMQEGEEEISYFPQRSQHEWFPKPYSKLKPKLAALYKEAITCYNHEALIMCAVGLRALLEGICEDKKIKGRNLKAKIEGLVVSLPNRNIITNLHHFRFMGNEAAHELAAPKPTELLVAISVIEDLLSLFYELDYKASLLRDMRRAKKTKTKITRKSSGSINRLKDEVATALEPAKGSSEIA